MQTSPINMLKGGIMMTDKAIEAFGLFLFAFHYTIELIVVTIHLSSIPSVDPIKTWTFEQASQ